jgi:hypothetical protein
MRLARVLAGLLVAGLVVAACVPPPPPPPPFTLANLNGFFTGRSSYTNGPECPIAHELFFDIEYKVPNAANEVDLHIGGCVNFPSVGLPTYNGAFTIETEVGNVAGRAKGTIGQYGTVRDGTHELTLKADFGTGEFRGVTGSMRARLECDCGFQPPDTPIPVNGVLVSLYYG